MVLILLYFPAKINLIKIPALAGIVFLDERWPILDQQAELFLSQLHLADLARLIVVGDDDHTLSVN